MIDTDLSGRVALVTGSQRPSGIGAAIARALARQGVAVALTSPHDSSTTSPAAEVLRELRGLGVACLSVAVDLSRPDECDELYSHVEAELGPVDVLVNNAAHCTPDSFHDDGHNRRTIDPQILDLHHAVNVRAPALLMRRFYQSHSVASGRWGRIINISTDGAPGFAGEVSYGATKSALESLSRAAAFEFADRGITVNIVAPGPIQTGWMTPEAAKAVGAQIPLGRVGEPQDVADVVVFLASAQARWVTGQTIFVGGGHRMI